MSFPPNFSINNVAVVSLIVPSCHITVVAEGPVANAVFMGAESLLGLGASNWGRLGVSAIVIGVVYSPIDNGYNYC